MTATDERDTLDVLIHEIITERISQFRVCLPAKILKYDPDTHLASVQPLLKRKFYKRKNSEMLPVINRVPVLHPRTSSAIVRLPVKKGDLVTLVFADRSLENWIAGNGEAKDPLDSRMHHLNDAYAILGGYPEQKPLTANNPNALEIQVESGTKLTIGNGQDELLKIAHDAFTSMKQLADQLKSTLTEIQLITHNDSVGGVTSPPLNITNFANISSQVDTILTEINNELSSLGNIKV